MAKTMNKPTRKQGMRSGQLQKGFTILELMIVGVVFALISAMAAPAFDRLISRNAQQQVTSDISIGLLYARSEAVKQNMEARVYKFSNAWAVYTYDGSTFRMLEYNYLPDDVTITGPYYISFSPNGRARPISGTSYYEVTMDNNAELPKRCIYVTAAGVAKVLIDNDDDGNCANG